MLRTLMVFRAILVAVGVCTCLCAPAAATPAGAPGTLHEMPLPGGLRAALAALHDSVPPDRAQFLLEVIRRYHDAPLRLKTDPRWSALQMLLEHLDHARDGDSGPADTLPLPLPASVWSDIVFEGRVAPSGFAASILRSRDRALFYAALLSLDEETRTWLATESRLIADLSSRYAARFLVAAPGIRVRDGAIRPPGGTPAEAAWEAVVGSRLSTPVDFVRALLDRRDGRLAYFFGSMSQLTPAQVQFALGPDSSAPAARVDSMRRLSTLFEDLGANWKVDQHAFWRPLIDPALLISDLPVDKSGRPTLPGSSAFWRAVFDGGTGDSAQQLAAGPSVDFAWLCEKVFANPTGRGGRYQSVLFASRVITQITPDTASAALETVRASEKYPALTMALERAKLGDIGAFASAARRAARLSSIGDEDRAARALAQYQGAIALVVRAACRGGIPASALAGLVSSLSAVDTNSHGDYEGRLARWIEEHMRTAGNSIAARAPASESANDGSADDPYGRAAGPVERDLLRLIAGAAPAKPTFVDWEGTRYRVDLSRAEANRLVGVLGDDAQPYLTWALALADLASALETPALTAEQLRRSVEGADPALRAGDATGSHVRMADALQRAAREGDVSRARNMSSGLRQRADELLARGLLTLVYASAFGQPEGPITASDAAMRHDFNAGGNSRRGPGPWHIPDVFSTERTPWHVTGSILGLDVALADHLLVRISSKPLRTSPALDGTERRIFVMAVALIEPASLSDSDRDTMLAAIKEGRKRLAEIRTDEDAAALADEIRLSPARRSLLTWTVAHDPGRISAFLSPAEQLSLGRGRASELAAWGAPAAPRLGCLCLQILDRRPWESFAGRWYSGMAASAFPDLNLRLAELLDSVRMPAALLAPVLAPATLDFVNTAPSRDPDDHRGLVEHVQSLRPEQVEEYLALLTTGGPLVPVGDAR